MFYGASQVALVVKNLPANAGDVRDLGFHSLGQEDPLEDPLGQEDPPLPWRRAWQPLQYSWLENLMDRGAWWSMVHRVAKRQLKWLSVRVCTSSRSDVEGGLQGREAGSRGSRWEAEHRSRTFSPTCITVASLLCRLPTLGYRVQFSPKTN